MLALMTVSVFLARQRTERLHGLQYLAFICILQLGNMMCDCGITTFILCTLVVNVQL